jgi:hypothetical protein
MTKQYAFERLFPAQSGGDQAWEELKTLLKQRIAQGLADELSERSINAILEAELGDVAALERQLCSASDGGSRSARDHPLSAQG